jgi:hypothetical protein
VAGGASGPDDGTVATEDDLHIGRRRIFGERAALIQPVTNLAGERHRVGLARVSDHAQVARLRLVGLTRSR